MKVHTFIYGVITVLQLNVATVLGGYSSANAYGYNWYADTLNTTYDGYQQAWRYLRHMIKCGYPTARYYEQDSHSHSGDNNQYRGNNWCQRYLIWAAVSVFCYQSNFWWIVWVLMFCSVSVSLD